VVVEHTEMVVECRSIIILAHTAIFDLGLAAVAAERSLVDQRLARDNLL
jgi:hypothetical protein